MLLLLISYLLWLFVCMSVLLFILLPACTFMCVNALSVCLPVSVLREVTECFIHQSTTFFIVLLLLLPSLRPPASLIPSLSSPFIPLSVPRDSVRLSSQQFPPLPHPTLHPLIILLPTHVSPLNTSPYSAAYLICCS